MSDTTPNRQFLPLLLTIASVIVVFTYQMAINLKVKAEQETAATQLEAAQKQREPLVEQSKKVQTGLQAIAEDLLVLAESDTDAAGLIKQFNIQRNAPAPAAP